MKQSAIIVPEGCKQVLLHACCAPCSSAIVEWLLAHQIEPIIYYYNPNIYPREEYEKRKAESKRHAESLGIKWIEEPTPPLPEGKEKDFWREEHKKWLQAVKGMENEPERGKRCEACFLYRLQKTAQKAQELGIPFFATTLASSRWKNLEQVNAAGKKSRVKSQESQVGSGRRTGEKMDCKSAETSCSKNLVFTTNYIADVSFRHNICCKKRRKNEYDYEDIMEDDSRIDASSIHRDRLQQRRGDHQWY